jgi:hypothetical protein
MEAITASCFICGKPILLEIAKTNEYGRAVHEECYVLRTKLKHPATPAHKSSASEPSAKRAPAGQRRTA